MNSTRFLRPMLCYTAAVVGLTALGGCQDDSKRVVLYCAQDKEFAEGILGQFRDRTGLEATPKFDTEADKSVSLVVELENEKERPRCDVFWNNEPVQTILLRRKGLLEPYDSPSAAAYPASARDKDHCWTAFANRARVLLVNTDQLKTEADRPKSLLELTDAKWKERVVMSRPQFGTGATQAACLFAVLGEEKAKKYYQGLKDNGVRITPGNKQAAEAVGKGDGRRGRHRHRRLAGGDQGRQPRRDHVSPTATRFPAAGWGRCSCRIRSPLSAAVPTRTGRRNWWTSC